MTFCSTPAGDPALIIGRTGDPSLGAGGGGGASPTRADDGPVFQPLSSEQDVFLQFGSQVGMGLGLTIAFVNLSAEELERVEVGLSFQDALLGLEVHKPPVLRCDADGSYHIEAMVMIDVGQHPTVTSVAQLDGQLALVSVAVVAHGETTQRTELPVTLNL